MAVIDLETMQDFFGALAAEEADALSDAEFDDGAPADW